jgi:2-dehydropantoate 2-reductase
MLNVNAHERRESVTSEPKIAIVGTGPVGGILGAYLAWSGHYVVLCDILKDHLDAIKEKGLTITGVSEMTAKCERLAYSISELSNFPELDTFVICTKASILPQVVPQIAATARPGARFICNQNGLDNEDLIAKTFGPDNVLRMVPNYAGSLTGDGEIWMSFFTPPNYIGALTDQGEPFGRQMAAVMTEAEIETQFTFDIKRYEWEKTLLNASNNPVCALTRKRIKEVMDFGPTESLVEDLLREGLEVAEAAGVTFDKGFFEQGVQHLKTLGYHKPSMLQDVERGAMTEIYWLNGKIIEHARAHGLKVPYHSAITRLVKGLEVKSTVPGEQGCVILTGN